MFVASNYVDIEALIQDVKGLDFLIFASTIPKVGAHYPYSMHLFAGP